MFNSELPDILINLARKKNAAGFFAYGRWIDEIGSIVHEIAINPDTFKHSMDIDFHQTLVHEMCHLWQYSFEKPSRRGYHNKEFADKMKEVGLMPSSTGRPDGNEVGQNMSDYPIKGGRFELSFKEITNNTIFRIKLPYEPNSAYQSQYVQMGSESINQDETNEPKERQKNKIAYSCKCGFTVWGKPNLYIIVRLP
ncbi:SprT-like domain-containing protein [Arachidicoccus soli]|uniref:SprT domain-containing protein n=1 Tax=Arachidicoccus soli TaxID=2341117 RepID=A0A386HNR7_9BACT|nr:SprT-like domain-containing protein [Arachidicoccus soli]AYD47150.1 sprT domain-containing protein [Arachidicoccus soli]